MHGKPRQESGQRDDSEQFERERSANACVLASDFMESLGTVLGPDNEDSETFLLWATDLRTHADHLRARSASVGAPASLRVVQPA